MELYSADIEMFMSRWNTMQDRREGNVCEDRFLAILPHIIWRRRENKTEEAGKACAKFMPITIDGIPIVILEF
jgi:hypothetical protein